jgi:hypothetical protein
MQRARCEVRTGMSIKTAARTLNMPIMNLKHVHKCGRNKKKRFSKVEEPSLLVNTRMNNIISWSRMKM